MTAAEELVTAAMSDRAEHDAITRAIRQLRSWVDITAERVTKANADWHDDPEGDPKGHAEYHAPAIEQFPREARDAAIMELVQFYLNETTLQESQPRPI
jgi:hypothetical protein